jgi:4-hydroxyphenylpyruvate dioxygenase
MDFKKFWNVSFHTPDYQSGKKGTGLSSQVMYDPASMVKFATNEPLYPHFNDSQIQTFVERNHGAGIQHLALSVDHLIDTIETLRSRGVEFLTTPDEYYNLLPERLAKQNVSNLKEDIDDLKKQGILVDGKDGKYLLQIFLKDASVLYHEEHAGPFFYEIIQRCGHPGFGEGNFRALFEAIELQESSQ